MLGPLVIVVVVVFAIPVLVLFAGWVTAAALGQALTAAAEESHQGSELVELNT